MKIIKEFHNFNSLALYLQEVLSDYVYNGFSAILAGGSTPLSYYKYLDNSNLGFKFGNFFLSDERIDASSESNFSSISNCFKGKVSLNGIDCTLPLDEAISRYDGKINEISFFDFAILGIGEDGHVASIFPNNVQNLHTDNSVILVNNSPKSPANRVSMTRKTLTKARCIIYILNGERKKNLFDLIETSNDYVYQSIVGTEKTYILYTKDEK
jgi:6-phosphogluconolactonase